MHIKFINRGTGKGSFATNYIVNARDHTGKKRDFPPEIMRGNPLMTGILADSLSFKHKYRSAVIAFHPEDSPTDDQLNEFLNEFERLAFAGLDPDQYSWTAVLHREQEAEHIHIIVPRVELISGKSMNISPPGWEKNYDSLRDYFNEKYEWKSPDIDKNPEISRLTRPHLEGTHKSLKALSRAETKQLINDYLTKNIISGGINNRADIIKSLTDLGFEIPRIGDDYITILDTDSKTRIRLKGAIYEQHWTVESENKTKNTDTKPSDRKDSSGGIEALRGTLEDRISGNAAYNQQRYSRSTDTFKPRLNKAINRQSTERNEAEFTFKTEMDQINSNNNEPLPDYLFRQLGAGAILTVHDTEAIKRNRTEQTDLDETKRKQRNKLSREITGNHDNPVKHSDFQGLQNINTSIENINNDRIRDKINEEFRAALDSIQAGYEHANRASEQLTLSSRKINDSIQRNNGIIQKRTENLKNMQDQVKTTLIDYKLDLKKEDVTERIKNFRALNKNKTSIEKDKNEDKGLDL